MFRLLQALQGLRSSFPKRFAGAVLCLAGALCASPIRAAVVTHGEDGGAGSLRAAVAAASPGATITFDPGVTTVTLTTGQITIPTSLTIQGNGAGGVTIQRDPGAGDFRIFDIGGVGGPGITLRGLTIRNGRGPNYGGGIQSVNSVLTIEDCVVADNQVSAPAGHDSVGGGVQSRSDNGAATLVVTRSLFTGNVAAAGGGMTSWANGGTVSATVSDSTFEGNTSLSGSGILNTNSAGGTSNLVVTGSTISNNLGDGAGVWTFSGSFSGLSSSTFTNTTISGNSIGGLVAYGQVGGAASQALHHVSVLNNTVHTVAAPGASAATSYDRSVFASADDNVTQYFFAAGAGSTTQTSGGYNVSKKDLPNAGATDLANTDPLLDPDGLYDNGGETLTVALLAGSPARDLIPNADCTLASDQRGVARPYPAAGACDSGAYEATPMPQAIDFTGPGAGAVGESASLSATGGASGNPVVFSVDATSGAGVCNVSGVNGSSVNYTAAGTCVINASQAGNDDYAAAPQAQQTISVDRGSQSITANPGIPGAAVYGTTFLVSGSASSGLSIVITVTGGCSIDGGTVTMTSGTTPCTLRFLQPGDANYYPTPELEIPVVAQKASQTIAFAPLADRKLNQSPVSVGATASSGLPIVFSTTTPLRCTADGANGATITLVATGTCTIEADQAGNADYAAAAPVMQSFTIGNKADQTITVVGVPPASAVYGSSFGVSATASSSLTVAITASGGCSIASGTVTMKSGTAACAIRFNQPGNPNFNPAPEVVYNVTAQKAAQTITVTAPAPSSAIYNMTFTVAATTSSGLPVTIVAEHGCTNKGTSVRITSGTSTCFVYYRVTGNLDYLPAPQVVNTVTTSKSAQGLSFAAIGDKKLRQSPVTVSAKASSGLPVTFWTTTPGVCTSGGTNGATITLVATGTCWVMADQLGNADYLSAGATGRSFTVK